MPFEADSRVADDSSPGYGYSIGSVKSWNDPQLLLKGPRADDENDDDDDDDGVAVSVRGRQTQRTTNWGNQLTVPAGGGGRGRSPEEEGSTTPYHIIEILINSGGDNLPGVSSTYCTFDHSVAIPCLLGHPRYS